jgi:hypothetical protein
MNDNKNSELENTRFLSKMKECPSCGNTDFPIFPNMETNYFFLGIKETWIN